MTPDKRDPVTRLLPPLIIGLVGAAILVSLGLWQVQRLAWKEGILSEIESTIAGAPAALPDSYDPDQHRYLPVTLDGEIGRGEIHVLVSQKQQGAGYRIIAPFTTQGRTILIDRGFVPNDAKDAERRVGPATISANLHAPDERNGFTPENEVERNIWFSRDLRQMAGVLDTEPMLAIVRSEAPTAPGIAPLPVSTEGIPNDHLQYAITWFSLAAIWVGMTAFWILRRTAPREART